MVKTSSDIDKNLHKAIKKKAIDSDVTIKAYIVEVLRRDIEEEGKEYTRRMSASLALAVYSP